jgi:hypothetical protein
MQLSELVLLDKGLEADPETAEQRLVDKPPNSTQNLTVRRLPCRQLVSLVYPFLLGSLLVSIIEWHTSHPSVCCYASELSEVLCSRSEIHKVSHCALRSTYQQTFILLLSRCSSLQSFSNFSFKPTVLLSSVRLASLSFCRLSPRRLFF